MLFLHFVKAASCLYFDFDFATIFFPSLLFFNHIRQSIGTQSRTIRHLILFIITLTKTTTTRAIGIKTTREFTTNLKWIGNLFLVARQRQRNHIFKRRCDDSRPQKCDWWIPYTNTITITTTSGCMSVRVCVGVGVSVCVCECPSG